MRSPRFLRTMEINFHHVYPGKSALGSITCLTMDCFGSLQVLSCQNIHSNFLLVLTSLPISMEAPPIAERLMRRDLENICKIVSQEPVLKVLVKEISVPKPIIQLETYSTFDI